MEQSPYLFFAEVVEAGSFATAARRLGMDRSNVSRRIKDLEHTAGVQLLMLAKRTAQKQQGQLRLVGHSAAVLEVFDLLHLAAYFGDDLVIPQPLGAARA